MYINNNITMSFFVGQLIKLNNGSYNVSSTCKIIKITNKYLICEKIKTFNKFSFDNNDKFIIHTNFNINDDINDNINLYGSYKKKFNDIDEFDILYNNEPIKILKNNTCIIN